MKEMMKRALAFITFEQLVTKNQIAFNDDLGYLGDANVTNYAATTKNVQKKCQKPKFVIVGHGDWASVNSLEHTLIMAQQKKRKTILTLDR